MDPHRLLRPALLTAVVAALTLGVSAAPASAHRSAANQAAAIQAAPPVPDRMASLGDSITRGFNACGWYVDCTSRSFSTGSDSGINSQFLRLRSLNGSLTAYNDAVSGARISDLNGQAAAAVSQGVGYVTILMGANDACRSSESSMTSVADFETRFRAAMTTLRQGLPDALIFVASIPDIKRLWEVGRVNGTARFAWSTFGICQSMLANPTSTAAADVARRDRVQQRVIAFNGVLAAVCAQQPVCRYDGDATFGYRFTLSQVSGWDYFHPNASGQREIARVTYERSFWGAALRRAA